MDTGHTIGPPKKGITVDGRKLFASVVKVAIGGLTAWAEYFSGTVSPGDSQGARALADAFASTLTSFSEKTTNEGKAWTLLALCLASALHAVRTEGVSKSEEKEVQAAFEALKKELLGVLEAEPSAYALTQSFFKSPTQSPIYVRLRPALVAGATAYLPSEARKDADSIKQLAARLDSAFTCAVYETLLKNESTFESLQRAVFVHGYQALRLEFDWKRYRSRLIEQFEVMPIPGEEQSRVSLSHIYVPLRATWQESAKGDRQRSCGMLHDVITEWVRANDDDSRVRVVVGGPGAGKSTFAKALACELARNDAVRPLYQPLHRLDSIQESPIGPALLKYLKRWGGFSTDPFAEEAINFNVPYVLIFDGLDELVRPGSAGVAAVAGQFAEWLRHHLESIHWRGMAIVTGRPVMIDAFMRELPGLERRHMLQIEGLAPLDARKLRLKSGTSADALIARDMRPEWWRRYALASGASLEVPAVFRGSSSEDLTHEPLLAYLIAVLGAEDADWCKLTANLAELYGTLMRKIWERSWGDAIDRLKGRRTGPGGQLEFAEFNQLMQCVAFAAWLDGGLRVATQERFTRARIALRIPARTWERFKKDMGEDLGALALTFYFRSADVERQGFEFTHKTFGEFLVAQFLLEQFFRLTSAETVASADRESILLEWLLVGAGSVVDTNVLGFLRQLALLRDHGERFRARRHAEGLLFGIVKEGFPTHRIGYEGIGAQVEDLLQPQSGEELEDIQRCARINFLACLNAIVEAEYHLHKKTELIAVDWPSQEEPAKFLSRLVVAREPEATGVLGLSHFAFSSKNQDKKVIFAPLMSGVYLAGANLCGSCLAGAQLDRANFANSNLTQADLGDAVADHADFSWADCTEANFEKAALQYADFRGAKIKGASFVGADLTGADLRSVSLADAVFTGAKLDGVTRDP